MRSAIPGDPQAFCRGKKSLHPRQILCGFWIALLSAAVLLTQVAPALATPQADALVSIARLREAWTQDLHDKHLEAILKFYAADASFLQPSGERIAGQTALRGLFTTVMGTFDSNLTLHSVNVEISGDLAYDSGDYQETLVTINTGAKATARGGYLMVFKRQTGGEWKIVQHVWTGTITPEQTKGTK
jgi:ketosteroid isomerase-like protein